MDETPITRIRLTNVTGKRSMGKPETLYLTMPDLVRLLEAIERFKADPESHRDRSDHWWATIDCDP